MVEIKRRCVIIFETREIQNIRDDYFNHKWISKEELTRLLESEETEFVRTYNALYRDYHDLLSYFNMNSLANYELLERKEQGNLKK